MPLREIRTGSTMIADSNFRIEQMLADIMARLP
jgi:hypothetical protein